MWLRPSGAQIGRRPWPIDRGSFEVAEEKNAGLLLLALDRALGGAPNQIGRRDQKPKREVEKFLDVVIGLPFTWSGLKFVISDEVTVIGCVVFSRALRERRTAHA
jgi:hypothetical protein